MYVVDLRNGIRYKLVMKALRESLVQVYLNANPEELVEIEDQNGYKKKVKAKFLEDWSIYRNTNL